MDEAKVVEVTKEMRPLVVALCRARLGRIPKAKRMDPDLENVPDYIYLPHLLYMCREIPRFAKQGWLAKAERWMSFIQGALSGRYGISISTLKKFNMPLSDTFNKDA